MVQVLISYQPCILILVEIVKRHLKISQDAPLLHWPFPGCWDLFGWRRSSPTSNCFIHERPPLSLPPSLPAKAILYCELLTDRRQQPNMLQHKPVSISSDSVEVCIYVNQYVKKALIKKQEFLDICSPGVLSLWLQWRAGRGIGSKWGVNWMMVMGSRPGGGELCRTTVANFTPICSHIPAALQAATLKFYSYNLQNPKQVFLEIFC